MLKHPFSDIVSLLSYAFTFKVDDTHEYTIPAGVGSKAAEPNIQYTANSIGAWKLNTDSTDKNYVTSVERASRKKTVNLPDPVLDGDGFPTKLYLVPAEVAAVGRKIEKRKDLITPADLIRARYNDNRYIKFMDESAIPAT